MSTLLAELKRRSVVKVGAAYLVSGWVAVQVASIALPAFEAPPWALRTFIFVVLLGFPLALALAWSLQITTSGMRVEPSSRGTRRFYLVALALVAIAVAWYFLGQPAFRRPAPEGSTRSIAVLPFVNMSGDSGNDYFSDGISEEILNALAQVPRLEVAARTSSFSFKGQAREIPDIARELGVRMVLEGSVRKQGDRVRVTAQLIDAADGYHVWSQTFERDLRDIFAIQDEIAHAVAGALQVKLGLGDEHGKVRRDTTDLQAYEHYLRGLALWQARGRENLDAAERQFESAVRRDTRFARAWAGIALVESLRPDWFGTPASVALPKARDAAERALALDPLLPEAYAALGEVAYLENRTATGSALYERALAIAPSYATAWQWYGWGLAMSGYAEEALPKSRRAVELDPKSPIVRQDYANTLYLLARYDEMNAECARILDEPATGDICLSFRFQAALARKQFDVARDALRRKAQSRGEPGLRFVDSLMDGLEGKRDLEPLARQLLDLPDAFLDPSTVSPLRDPDVILWLTTAGRPADAVERLRRVAVRQRSDAQPIVFDPSLDGLRCREDFKAVIRMLAVEDVRARRLCQGGH